MKAYACETAETVVEVFWRVCGGIELFRPGFSLGPAARSRAGALAPLLHPVLWLPPPPGEPGWAGVLALGVLGYPGYMQQGSFWYEISVVMNWRRLKLFAVILPNEMVWKWSGQTVNWACNEWNRGWHTLSLFLTLERFLAHIQSARRG